MTSRIQVFRYLPGEEATYATYELPFGSEITVLQALFYMARDVEHPPAFRRYQCNRGQCCSCLMAINGRVRRACCTKLEDGMVLEPLPNHPVIRDLVVDFGLKRYQDTAGSFILRRGTIFQPSPFLHREAVVDRNQTRGLIFREELCNNCGICLRVCPVNKFDHLETIQGKSLPLHQACIRPQGDKISLAGACPQCAPAPCIAPCPTGAIYKEKGIVYIQRDLCIGCGLCLGACPVETIFLNMERGFAAKCDLCGGNPLCVRGCKPKALVYADAAAPSPIGGVS
ncbi:MAG: 4Fe-4S binding protein [Chloroflexi bacterium]|nr:4Fe-4S binding protein [Chloroflexota bacterium]